MPADGRLGTLRPIAVDSQQTCRLPRRKGQPLAGLASLLVFLLLSLTVWLGAAHALAVDDLPALPPQSHVLDSAGVLSRAGAAEIEKLLDDLSSDRVDARLITVNHLDYGLALDQLGDSLMERWSAAPKSGGSSAEKLLLILIDTQTRTAAVVAEPPLERQLPVELLRSTARTTMGQPLRAGDRYRQASVDALQRLTTVLRGGEDPGEPAVEEAPVVVSNIPSQEETAGSKAFTWVIVLLVVGTVVPMLTWWVFSR